MDKPRGSARASGPREHGRCMPSCPRLVRHPHRPQSFELLDQLSRPFAHLSLSACLPPAWTNDFAPSDARVHLVGGNGEAAVSHLFPSSVPFSRSLMHLELLPLPLHPLQLKLRPRPHTKVLESP
ncbi:hypothetical protein CRG98_038047 [Punica granatum]|uniref:Uncharacterized protein n=1 Tax=Punica granatum TaxID=22663 RepID=A0A2I0IDS3_PUNGR|nr:hypothetical protein CRG98_038047 [Punica granatum]